MHENLSSDLEHSHKSLGWQHVLVTSELGFSRHKQILASLASQQITGETWHPVFKNKMENNIDGQWRFTYGLHKSMQWASILGHTHAYTHSHT